MDLEKFYHKCGYPILLFKRSVGLATETLFLDGNTPFIEGKDGKKSPKLIKACPECGGTIKPEKLLSTAPEASKEKRASGYMPARI